MRQSATRMTAPTEHSEQCALIQWWRLQYPQKERALFAIPNGGNRNVITGNRLKAEGVRAGVPDLFLAMAAGAYHGLFIEMKRARGGRLSPAQKDMIEALEAEGYQVAVCHGWIEARAAILNYIA